MGDHDTIPTKVCHECGVIIYWDNESLRWLETKSVTVHTPFRCEEFATMIGNHIPINWTHRTYMTSGEYLHIIGEWK